MTRPHLEDEQMMAYLDGELGAQEARTVEERLARFPEASGKLEGLRELGAALRDHYQREGAKAEPAMAALWARIETHLETPVQNVKDVKPRRSEPTARPFGFVQLRDWAAAYWGHALWGAACAAAGALIALWLRDPRDIVREHVVVRQVELPAPRAPEPSELRARSEPTHVNQLEVSGGSGMVFRIPSDQADDAPITVIWVERRQPTGPEGPI